MAHQSTQIIGKVRSCLFVLSALSTQGPRVLEAVRAQIRPTLPAGEEPPDLLGQVLTLGHLLKAQLDAMVELDNELVCENRRRFELLRSRDDAALRLGQRVRGIRHLASGLYVAPDLTRLGLVGEISREPIAVILQAETVCQQLRAENLDEMLGEVLFESPHDLRADVEQIEPTIAETLDAHDSHLNSRRRVDRLLAKKKEAIATYDNTFLRVARQFEDFCRLAGENELADKVRPSSTRKGEARVKPDDEVQPSSTLEGETRVKPKGDELPASPEEAVASRHRPDRQVTTPEVADYKPARNPLTPQISTP